MTKENVTRLKIVTTEKSARELAKYENDHMPEGLIMYVAPEDILRYDKLYNRCNQIIISWSKGNNSKSKTTEISKSEPLDKSKVFIVHGHDNEAKLEIARFIEQMGFEPIILHEQASKGMTIIEKNWRVFKCRLWNCFIYTLRYRVW